jgi:hypothetical protein
MNSTLAAFVGGDFPIKAPNPLPLPSFPLFTRSANLSADGSWRLSIQKSER